MDDKLTLMNMERYIPDEIYLRNESKNMQNMKKGI